MTRIRFNSRKFAGYAGAPLLSAPLFLASRTAASVRTNFELGAANVPTNFEIGALITPNNSDTACARVGNEATRSRSCGLSNCPPKDTTVVTSLSLSFENALTIRAAAPGSSLENARTMGPFSAGEMHSKAVPATALRASVFLTIRRYTPSLRAFARRSVICVTVKPRFSAPTTDRAFAATALTSATTTFFSSNLSAIFGPRKRSVTHKAERRRPALPLSTPSYSLVRPSPGIPDSGPTICAGRSLRALARLRSSTVVAFDRTVARSPPSIQKLNQAQTRLIDRDAGAHGRGDGQFL